jgi:hypothetical protein
MLATVFVALAAVAAPLTAPAQDSTGAPPPSPPLEPAPPTPEQLNYIQGLRSVARGAAQLRDAIDRVVRTQQTRDTVRQRQAGRRLGGYCATARRFMANGRPRMQATAYTDSMRIVARQLAARVDSVVKFLPTCETTAGKKPASVAADLVKRMQAYETALAAFRAGLAPPKADSIQTPSQQ